MEGKIKWYEKTKGYGFISEDNCDADWFFHHKQLIDKDIQAEDRVTFEEGEGRKGPIAVNVKRLM